MRQRERESRVSARRAESCKTKVQVTLAGIGTAHPPAPENTREREGERVREREGERSLNSGLESNKEEVESTT